MLAHDFSIVERSYEAVVGPHATTERWRYIVPARRLAVLEHVFLLVEREDSVPVLECYVAVPGGLFIARLFNRSDEVRTLSYAPQLFLPAGTEIQGVTTNASATQHLFSVHARFREYY